VGLLDPLRPKKPLLNPTSTRFSPRSGSHCMFKIPPNPPTSEYIWTLLFIFPESKTPSALAVSIVQEPTPHTDSAAAFELTFDRVWIWSFPRSSYTDPSPSDPATFLLPGILNFPSVRAMYPFPQDFALRWSSPLLPHSNFLRVSISRNPSGVDSAITVLLMGPPTFPLSRLSEVSVRV